MAEDDSGFCAGCCVGVKTEGVRLSRPGESSGIPGGPSSPETAASEHPVEVRLHCVWELGTDEPQQVEEGYKASSGTQVFQV